MSLTLCTLNFGTRRGHSVINASDIESFLNEQKIDLLFAQELVMDDPEMKEFHCQGTKSNVWIINRMSRMKMISIESHPQRDDFDINRLLHMKFNIDDKIYDIVSVHSPVARNGLQLLFNIYISKLFRMKDGIILGGDFNVQLFAMTDETRPCVSKNPLCEHIQDLISTNKQGVDYILGKSIKSFKSSIPDLNYGMLDHKAIISYVTLGDIVKRQYIEAVFTIDGMYRIVERNKNGYPFYCSSGGHRQFIKEWRVANVEKSMIGHTFTTDQKIEDLRRIRGDICYAVIIDRQFRYVHSRKNGRRYYLTSGSNHIYLKPDHPLVVVPRPAIDEETMYRRK